MIPEGWKKYKLKEIVEDVAMGPFGSNLKVDNFIKSGVPVIRGSNLNKGGFQKENFAFVSEEKAQSLKRCLAYPDDLVFTHRGTLGQVGIIPQNEYPYYLVSQSQMRLTVNRLYLNPKFLFYYFLSSKGQSELLKNVSQVGVPAIANPTRSLKEVNVLVPPLPEQIQITSILSSLDDKIEHNLQMNKTLEAIAQAIFKEWFVDFRFPGYEGELIDGLPKGWIIGSLGDYCRIYRGASPRPITDPKYFNNGIIPWIKIADATSENSIYITKSKQYCTELAITKSRFIRIGTLVLSNSATVGIPKILNIDGCVHDGWLIFDNYKLITRNFLFFILHNNLSRFISYADGSVQKNLNTEILKNLKFIVPDQTIILKFDTISQTIFNKLLSNEIENQNLIEIRDTLLPRLMTGKIRVT